MMEVKTTSESITNQREINCILHYFRIFCQRSSIRGVPKIESSKQPFLKCFWFLFVIISFAVLINLLSFLILRFLRYDTIIKNTFHRGTSQDFPEITICSKRFFKMEQNETKTPFAYLEEYTSKIYSKVLHTIEKGDYEDAMHILKYQYTVSAFYHDQFDFIYERTLKVVNSLKKKCLIIKTGDSSVTYCNIKAVFHPLYLNCLAFRIPENFNLNSTRFHLEFNLRFAQMPNNYFIEKFKMDEFINDVAGSGGYQDTRLYIHSPDDYPFDAKYEVPLDCLNYNYYIVDKVTQIIYPNNINSNLNCRNFDLILSAYNISYTVIGGILCRSLILQANIYDTCNCLMPNKVTNFDSFRSIKTCVENSTLYSCATEVILRYNEFASDNCEKSCNITYYNVLLKQSAIYSSTFSESMESNFDSIKACLLNSKDINNCCDNINNLLKSEFPINFNRTCPNTNKNQSIADTFSNVAQNKEQRAPHIIKEINNTVCPVINVKVILKSEKNLQVETLVVELNTLLSQMAGMCSFITGFTFTFIGEVIEIFLMWLSQVFLKCFN